MEQPLRNLFEKLAALVPEESPVAEATAAPPGAGETGGAEEVEEAKPPESAEPAPPPVRLTERTAVGYDLDAALPPEAVKAGVAAVNEAGFAIDAITGVDWPDQDEIELIYDFCHFTAGTRVVLRTRLDRAKPEIATVSDVFPGANWHERETAEFFGVDFKGHPNPIHLLLPEDFEGYPLRRDFRAATNGGGG